MLNILHAAYRGTWSLRNLPGALYAMSDAHGAAYLYGRLSPGVRQCFVSQGEWQLSTSRRSRLAEIGLRVGFSRVFLIA
jgi:hypothetical protein